MWRNDNASRKKDEILLMLSKMQKVHSDGRRGRLFLGSQNVFGPTSSVLENSDSYSRDILDILVVLAICENTLEIQGSISSKVVESFLSDGRRLMSPRVNPQ